MDERKARGRGWRYVGWFLLGFGTRVLLDLLGRVTR